VWTRDFGEVEISITGKNGDLVVAWEIAEKGRKGLQKRKKL